MIKKQKKHDILRIRRPKAENLSGKREDFERKNEGNRGDSGNSMERGTGFNRRKTG